MHERYSHLSVTNAPQLCIVRGDASTEHSQPTKGKKTFEAREAMCLTVRSANSGAEYFADTRHRDFRATDLSRSSSFPWIAGSWFLSLAGLRSVVFVVRWPPIHIIAA